MSRRALERFAPLGPPAGWRKTLIGEALIEIDEPIEMRDDVEYDLVSVRRRFGGMFHRERLYGRQILTKTLRRVVPGTFVIARMQIVHGACTYVTPDYAGGAISKSYSSFGSTPLCDARYFSYLAEQPFMLEYFRDASQGVVIEKMTFQQDRWLGFPVYLPPLEEQRRIAEILETVDATIHATEDLVRKLQQVRRGVELDLLGELPLQRPLGEVAEIYNGTTPSRARPEYWKNGSIPWLASGKVNDRVVTSVSDFVTPHAVKVTGLRTVPRGATVVGLIGQGRTRGMAAKLAISATINQNLAAVIPGTELDESFLLHEMRFRYPELRAAGRGSNQDALNCVLLRRFEISVPSLDEQRSISQSLDSVDEQIEAESAVWRGLAALRLGLAADLLSGRVRTVVA